MESRLRFHYLAFDWGLWLCPREDCTFPLGHEDLDSFMVKVSNKSSGGSLSSLSSVPDVDVRLLHSCAYAAAFAYTYVATPNYHS